MSTSSRVYFLGTKVFVASALLLLQFSLSKSAPAPVPQTETTVSYAAYGTKCDSTNSLTWYPLIDCNPIEDAKDPLLAFLLTSAGDYTVRGFKTGGKCFAACLPVDGKEYDVPNVAPDYLASLQTNTIFLPNRTSDQFAKAYYGGGATFQGNAVTPVVPLGSTPDIAYRNFTTPQAITKIYVVNEQGATVT